MKKAIIGIIALLIAPLLATAGGATFWEINKQSDVERGDAKGVSISDNGEMKPSPAFLEIFNTEQPFIFSSAADASGNIYLGTGHDGRIYKVDKSGKGAILLDTNELDVTALTVDSSGNVYAATSPDGKVYRISPSGDSSVYFDPEDKYIWSLAIDKSGNLFVGTGDKGTLYKVDSKGASSVFVKTNEKHIISLAFDKQNNLLAGTDPNGLVLRINSDGKMFALLDSPLREIHSIVADGDGAIYALALSTQSSSSSSPTPPTVASTSSEGSGTVTVIASFDDDGTTVVSGGSSSQSTTAQSRSDVSSSKAALYRITPDGGNDVLMSAKDTVAFSLALDKNGRALVGTGNKGRVYEIDPKTKNSTLLVQSTEEQASTLLSIAGGIYVTSSNTGKLFRIGGETVKEGFYTSPVHDTKFTAVWGRISWSGAGAVEIQTRSGNTESPDATWSDWSSGYKSSDGQQVASPPARFIQWRAHLQENGALRSVKLAYLLRNIAPEVTQITVLAPGVALQEIPQQPVDPGIISAGLDPSTFGLPNNIQPRKVFQKGARSLQWQAEDRNGDTLSYNINYREDGDAEWHLLVADLKSNYFTLDADSLPDGKYKFRVTATDVLSNPGDRALQGELISDVIEIDNTPPQVTPSQPRVNGRKIEITFSANDNLSVLRRAEYSLNGGPWQTIFPEDGIADSRSETYVVKTEAPSAGEHTIAFRCYDDDANAGSAKVSVRVK